MSPDAGWYVVDTDDETLVPVTPNLVDTDNSTLIPVTISHFPGLGLPNPPGGDPGGGGGDPANDWRNEPLLDPGAGRVVWGMYTSTGDSLDALGTLWGRAINLTRVYTGSGAILDGVASAQTHLNNGRVPMISVNWKNELKTYVTAHMSNIGGTGKTLPKFMADGNFDGDTDGLVDISGGPQNVPGFKALARKVKALTAGSCPTNTVVLTPWHEFESQSESGFGWSNSSSTDQGNFRGAWQQMRSVFDDEGVDNVIWGFCGATGVSHWGSSLTDTGCTGGFYPGHSFVDFVMWDPYNSAGQQTCSGTHGPRYGNSWEDFGTIGDRGDGHTNTVLNRWGQMTWWFDNFKMGGKPTAAEVTGSEGVYKPVWLGECGTGEYDPDTPTNPAKQADVWFDDMIAYFGDQVPGVDMPLRGICYFHNQYNVVTCSGSHRRAGFAGRGAEDAWAPIEVTG